MDSNAFSAPDLQSSGFSFPCVVSDLPAPEEYLVWLKQAHARNYFSNFGPLCEQLSNEMLATFGFEKETCVPCASATAGLSAALIAANVSGFVLIPGFTFPATASAVLAAGLTPLIIDVEEESWVVGADELDAALSRSGAKAAILVAPFGMHCDFSPHLNVCRQHDAVAVIDNAAGLGVVRTHGGRGQNVFEVFSLHATKPMGIGEGGLIFCHETVEGRLKSALNFGLATYHQPAGPIWGFNGKLSELHAAIGLAQLRRRDWIVLGRQQFVTEYIRLAQNLPQLNTPDMASRAPWQIFPIAMPDAASADRAEKAAMALGVEFRRYYRPSLSQWPGLKTIGPCPVSESLSSRMVALPVRSITHAKQASELVGLAWKAVMSAI
ncbi:aminotransferase class I/II-fold pyridoxal phosphate-dependent enzyme [soil metagenome]